MKLKMKIFFFINTMHTAGGTERMTAVIANALANYGWNIGIVCLYGGGTPFFKVNNTIKIYYVNHRVKNSYCYFLNNLFKLRKLYKKEKPDFVVDVCSAMSLLSIPAVWGTKINVITWEHFNANMDWNPVTSPLSRKLAVHYASKIVSLTRQDAAIYRQRYKATNVVVIPNPVTIDVTNKTKLTAKRVLAIGRFTPQKGFDLLIEAWHKVSSRNNGWTLRIVGAGEMQELLEQLVQKYNLSTSVEILPPTANVNTLYFDASIYALSSRFEGLPLVLIEAMAMGLPVVSFDCKTGPREIVVSGKTGILVEPENTGIFAKELDNLMQDLSKQRFFSQNAVEESKRFELFEIMNHWVKLFETKY
jgi:glycosyltransferase involved in cell wall biosynthesis